MTWGEYLKLAEAQKRNQIAVREGVLLCALVLAPLLIIGLRLRGEKLNSGLISVTGSLPTPSSQAQGTQERLANALRRKGTTKQLAREQYSQGS
jgi:hypothetical protein